MATFKRLDSSYKDEEGLLEFFCNTSLIDKWEGSSNMDTIDWENRPETLFNQLYKQKIYDGNKAGLWILEDDGEIVCSIGLHYIEEINCGVVSRVYAKSTFNRFKKIRTLNELFAYLRIEVINKIYDGFIIFANSYNLRFLSHLVTVNLSGDKFTRTKEHSFLENFDKEVIYKHTRQRAIFHIINEDRRVNILDYLNGISD